MFQVPYQPMKILRISLSKMFWGSLTIEVSTKKISYITKLCPMTSQMLPKDLAMKCHAENEIVEEVPRSRFNGDERIDVYFATFKQCVFNRKACKTIGPCLWFRRIVGWICVWQTAWMQKQNGNGRVLVRELFDQIAWFVQIASFVDACTIVYNNLKFRQNIHNLDMYHDFFNISIYTYQKLIPFWFTLIDRQRNKNSTKPTLYDGPMARGESPIRWATDSVHVFMSDSKEFYPHEEKQDASTDTQR